MAREVVRGFLGVVQYC